MLTCKPMIEVLKSGALVIKYPDPNFPIIIRKGKMSEYPNKTMPVQWHEDIEFFFVIDGLSEYYIGGHHIKLSSGDMIFINSGQVHMNSTISDDSDYIIIAIHPRMLSLGIMKNSLAEHLLKDMRFCYHVCRNNSENATVFSDIIFAMSNAAEEGGALSQLDIVSLTNQLYRKICECYTPANFISTEISNSDQEILRNIILFIYNNFSQKLSLEEIASSGHVSRSKCCQIFRRFTGQTPIDFLNTYRLKISQEMLTNTKQSVTEIALACGFNHLSYFSRLFLRVYGCTPSEYRAQAASGPDQ